MGIFEYPVAIVADDGSVIETVNAWVDTGSTYSWLPQRVFDRLPNAPTATRTFRLADGTREVRSVAQIRVSLGGEAFLTYCAPASENDELLLGAVALEEAGLAVDPVERRLVPADAYALIRLEETP